MLLLFSKLLDFLHKLVPLMDLNKIGADLTVTSDTIGQKGPRLGVFPSFLT